MFYIVVVQNSNGKTVLNEDISVNKYQTGKYQSYVKVGGHAVYSIRELKLWVRL